ncbi:MAG: hypothetical protein AAFY51_08735 [Pseudomonadota bacterium]
MIHCICMVQEGQIAPAQEEALRSDTADFAQRHFGNQPEFNWVTVGEGNGFTEAKPSNSVIVSMNADRSLAPSQREPLLRELCEIWERGAGLSPNEVVTVIRDPQ